MTAELSEELELLPHLTLVETPVDDFGKRELLDWGVQEELFELTELGQLLERRLLIHKRVGELSIQLSKVQAEYSELINQTILLNGEIRDKGLDTSALLKQLQPSHGQYFTDD